MTDTSTQATTVDALVGSDWLERHLNDPKVCVVEVDVSVTAHQEGHIPGAVLWNIYTDLKDDAYEPKPTEAIEQLFRDSGISEDSIVVFYGYAPALGYWLMQHCGHSELRILNTDRVTWQQEARPWTTQGSAPDPTGYRIGVARPAIRATLPEVEDSITIDDHTILDVRSDLEFLGERFWPSGGTPEGGRAGRIPSAIHLPTEGLVAEDGSFLPAQSLTGVRSALDLVGTSSITTYCTVGARAATVWFVLTHILGYEGARVYDGSWAQWGMRPTVPVEQG